jgi:hypothetical protein
MDLALMATLRATDQELLINHAPAMPTLARSFYENATAFNAPEAEIS